LMVYSLSLMQPDSSAMISSGPPSPHSRQQRLVKTIDHLGGRVAQLLYGPILMSELWVAVDYVAAGFILYAAALFLTNKFGLFAQFKKWPNVSKAALYASPLLLLVGLYLCIAGGLTLGESLDADPPQSPS
jgi:hypothetical protein